MKSYLMTKDTAVANIRNLVAHGVTYWLAELGVGFTLEPVQPESFHLSGRLYYCNGNWFYYRIANDKSTRCSIDTSTLTTVEDVVKVYAEQYLTDIDKRVIIGLGNDIDYTTMWDAFQTCRYWKITEPDRRSGNVWTFEKTEDAELELHTGRYLDSVERNVVIVRLDETVTYTYAGPAKEGTFGNWLSFTQLIPIATTPEQNPNSHIFTHVGGVGLAADTLITAGILTQLLRLPDNGCSVKFKVMRNKDRFQLLRWPRPSFSGGLFLVVTGGQLDFCFTTADIYQPVSDKDTLNDVWEWYLLQTEPKSHTHTADDVPSYIETFRQLEQPWRLTALDVTVPSLFAVSGKLTLEVIPSDVDAQLIDFVLAREGNILVVNRFTLDQLDGFDIRFNHTVLKVGRATIDVSGEYPAISLI